MYLDRIRKARRYFGDHGFLATVRVAFVSVFYYPVRRWLDYRFDRRYGIDTTDPVHRSEFDVGVELQELARNYGATPDRTFTRFLRQQKLDFSDYCFIDLGCGKGRTLLLASQFPFKKIIGVELVPRIHDVCVRNVATYLARVGKVYSPIETHCMNAGDYKFPEGNILLYLFNPFGPEIMEQVVRQLADAMNRSPRRIRIVYFHPNFVSPLSSLANIRLISDETFRCPSSINNVGRVASYEVTP